MCGEKYPVKNAVKITKFGKFFKVLQSLQIFFANVPVNQIET